MDQFGLQAKRALCFALTKIAAMNCFYVYNILT